MRTPVSFAASALMMVGTSAAAVVVPVQPTGKWVVDFSEAQCTASRQYGDDFLVMKAPPLGEVVQLALFTKGRPDEPDQVDGHLRVDGGEPIKASALVFGSSTAGQRIHSVNLSLDRFAQVRSGGELQWRFPTIQRNLALAGMDKLMPVMDECIKDLRKVWNVRRESLDGSADGQHVPSVSEGTPARAKANLASYLRSDDYPGVAIRGDQDGTVAFSLLIDEKGAVADCTVVRTSGVAALDAQSCSVLKKRAKFEPAHDAAGKPVKDAVIGRIRWQLP